MAKKKSAPPQPAAAERLVHRMHTLLHTMHAIQSQEDAICTLMTEIKATGRLAPEAARELHQILDSIPAHGYVEDLEALGLELQSPELQSPETQA